MLSLGVDNCYWEVGTPYAYTLNEFDDLPSAELFINII